MAHVMLSKPLHIATYNTNLHNPTHKEHKQMTLAMPCTYHYQCSSQKFKFRMWRGGGGGGEIIFSLFTHVCFTFASTYITREQGKPGVEKMSRDAISKQNFGMVKALDYLPSAAVAPPAIQRIHFKSLQTN